MKTFNLEQALKDYAEGKHTVVTRDGSKKTVIVQGSNRSGKTTFLIVSAVSLCLGKEWWSGVDLRFKPPIRARLVGEDWTHHVGQVLMQKLREEDKVLVLIKCPYLKACPWGRGEIGRRTGALS